MELLIFGHGGSPYLVFPTSLRRFYEYENMGMISAVQDRYEQGQLQAFCVDGIDAESWYNRSAHPRDRVLRHLQYERYLIEEVLPLIRNRNWGRIGVTGCSFGGYHAANLAFRHPDLFASCVTMSGAFDVKPFLHGYYDDNCYFNCPVDFIANAHDTWPYRQMRIILGTGEWDICLGENRRFSSILDAKGIPHWLDVWGDHAIHDWPLWQSMARKLLT